MTDRFRLSTAGQVFRFIGGVCILGFKVLFGPSDSLSAKRNRNRLLSEIEVSFADLLRERAGRIHSNEGKGLPRAFDYAAVVMEFPEIRFRVIRGRGEIRVQVAPVHAGEDWHDLVLLWSVLATPEHPTPPAVHDSLDTIAKFLAEQWRVLVVAMGEGFPETEEKLRALGELPLKEQMALAKKDVS